MLSGCECDVHNRREFGGIVAGQQHDPGIARPGFARTNDADLAAGGEFVQHGGLVARHPRRKNPGFPRTGRQPHTRQLLHHSKHAVGTLQFGALPYLRNTVPLLQEPSVRVLAHRLGLLPRPRQTPQTNGPQHILCAILLRIDALPIPPLHHNPGARRLPDDGVRGAHAKAKSLCHVADDERPTGFGEAMNQLLQSVIYEMRGCRNPRRDGDSQGVAKQRSVRTDGGVLPPGNTYLHHAITKGVQGGEGLVEGTVRGQVIVGNRTDNPQYVRKLFSSAGLATGKGSLQLGVRLFDHVRVEQFPELHRT